MADEIENLTAEELEAKALVEKLENAKVPQSKINEARAKVDAAERARKAAQAKLEEARSNKEKAELRQALRAEEQKKRQAEKEVRDLEAQQILVQKLAVAAEEMKQRVTGKAKADKDNEAAQREAQAAEAKRQTAENELRQMRDAIAAKQAREADLRAQAAAVAETDPAKKAELETEANNLAAEIGDLNSKIPELEDNVNTTTAAAKGAKEPADNALEAAAQKGYEARIARYNIDVVVANEQAVNADKEAAARAAEREAAEKKVQELEGALSSDSENKDLQAQLKEAQAEVEAAKSVEADALKEAAEKHKVLDATNLTMDAMKARGEAEAAGREVERNKEEIARAEQKIVEAEAAAAKAREDAEKETDPAEKLRKEQEAERLEEEARQAKESDALEPKRRFEELSRVADEKEAAAKEGREAAGMESPNPENDRAMSILNDEFFQDEQKKFEFDEFADKMFEPFDRALKESKTLDDVMFNLMIAAIESVSAGINNAVDQYNRNKKENERAMKDNRHKYFRDLVERDTELPGFAAKSFQQWAAKGSALADADAKSLGKEEQQQRKAFLLLRDVTKDGKINFDGMTTDQRQQFGSLLKTFVTTNESFRGQLAQRTGLYSTKQELNIISNMASQVRTGKLGLNELDSDTVSTLNKEAREYTEKYTSLRQRFQQLVAEKGRIRAIREMGAEAMDFLLRKKRNGRDT